MEREAWLATAIQAETKSGRIGGPSRVKVVQTDTGGDTMSNYHPLKVALRRLRAGKSQPGSCSVIKTLLARIRAAVTLDEVLVEGFPGIKALEDEQALEYWTGKASKRSRGNLQEDDLEVGATVLIKSVAPDTTGDMPWDTPRTQLIGHSARILAIQLPFVLLEMADTRAFQGGPISLDTRLVALMKASEEFFQAQRGTKVEVPTNPPAQLAPNPGPSMNSQGMNDASQSGLPF
jgi:hypothetical protein